MEDAQHFPSQEEDRQKDDHHGHQFSEGEPVSSRLEPPRRQADDVQSSEAEYDGPENVVNILPRPAINNTDGHAKQNCRARARHRVNRQNSPRSPGETCDYRHCRR